MFKKNAFDGALFPVIGCPCSPRFTFFLPFAKKLARSVDYFYTRTHAHTREHAKEEEKKTPRLRVICLFEGDFSLLFLSFLVVVVRVWKKDVSESVV